MPSGRRPGRRWASAKSRSSSPAGQPRCTGNEQKIAQFMKCECEENTPFHHIHATGSFGWRWMPEYVKELGVDLVAHPRIDMREYIWRHAAGAGSGGSDRLPRRCGDHCRGLCQRNALHHGAESERDRQPSGKRMPGCLNVPARPQSSAKPTATGKASMRRQSDSFRCRTDARHACQRPGYGCGRCSRAHLSDRTRPCSTDTHTAHSA